MTPGGVWIDSHVAAWLEHNADLPRLRVRVRGINPQVSQALHDIHRLAVTHRQQGGEQRLDETPEQPPQSDQWMSTREAADVLGVGRRAVRMAINRGRLKAERDGPGYRMHRTEVQRYMTARAA